MKNLMIFETAVMIVVIMAQTTAFGQNYHDGYQAAQNEEEMVENYGLDRRFRLTNSFRLTLDVHMGHSSQYRADGGVGITDEDVEYESLVGEALVRADFGLGDGFCLGVFNHARQWSDTYQRNMPLYLGGTAPELEVAVASYNVVGGELAWGPQGSAFHLFLQAGWRNLGWQYSPKWPVHLLAGFRWSTSRYFNLQMWGGTEIGLEIGVPFLQDRHAEFGWYGRGNYIWSEAWEFKTLPSEWRRNVIEAETGFRFNWDGVLTITVGARHTWQYGAFPNEKDADGQRVPALEIDSWYFFGGIGITF